MGVRIVWLPEFIQRKLQHLHAGGVKSRSVHGPIAFVPSLLLRNRQLIAVVELLKNQPLLVHENSRISLRLCMQLGVLVVVDALDARFAISFTHGSRRKLCKVQIHLLFGSAV